MDFTLDLKILGLGEIVMGFIWSWGLCGGVELFVCMCKRTVVEV